MQEQMNEADRMQARTMLEHARRAIDEYARFTAAFGPRARSVEDDLAILTIIEGRLDDEPDAVATKDGMGRDAIFDQMLRTGIECTLHAGNDEYIWESFQEDVYDTLEDEGLVWTPTPCEAIVHQRTMTDPAEYCENVAIQGEDHCALHIGADDHDL